MQFYCGADINIYTKKGGVGSWGGECTCPDGQVYAVGDNNDACGSLACVGGTVTKPCGNGNPISAHGMGVTCAAVPPPPTPPPPLPPLPPPPLPPTASPTLTCRAVSGSGAIDTWCDTNCNHNPPNCPSSMCKCTTDGSTDGRGDDGDATNDADSVACENDIWDQCGGGGQFRGPTCCKDGLTCVYKDVWASICKKL